MKETLTIIKNRRTTRKFKGEQIKDEELKEIIEAGIYAPSAHNQQSWNFTVIQNQDLINELSERTKKAARNSDVELFRKFGNNEKLHAFYGAPTIILVSGKEENSVPEVDCAAATENMLIAAETLDIGACWSGSITLLLNDEEEFKQVKDRLQIPKGFKPYHVVALGYKEVRVTKPLARRENTVQYIK